jgi:hypothetical protein
MIRFRKRNTAWLAALAILTTIGMIASAPIQGALIVQFMLLAIFAVAGIASTVELGRERETLIDALKRAPIRQRISPQAKEAGERARSRGGFTNNDLMLMDVGLIALQTSYEGMAMRRTRSISKDDDGARPFVTLNVDAAEADRNAVVRFEIYNQYGDQQFVHEMRSFLREGEMSIMTDHHLPLAGNREIEGTGDWDLRVYIDGNLVALHNFMLAPSINERQRRLERQDAIPVETVYEVIEEVEEEVPPRLQDLLGKQSSAAPNPTTNSTTRERPRTTRRRR